MYPVPLNFTVLLHSVWHKSSIIAREVGLWVRNYQYTFLYKRVLLVTRTTTKWCLTYILTMHTSMQHTIMCTCNNLMHTLTHVNHNICYDQIMHLLTSLLGVPQRSMIKLWCCIKITLSTSNRFMQLNFK